MLLLVLPFILHVVIGGILTTTVVNRARDGSLKDTGRLIILAAFCHSCYVTYLVSKHVVFDYKIHTAMLLYSISMLILVANEQRGLQLYIKSLVYVLLSGTGLAWSIFYVLTNDSIYADPILVKTMVQISVQSLCMFIVSFITFITNYRYAKKFGSGVN